MRIICPSCNRQNEITHQQIGTRFKCPSCGELVILSERFVSLNQAEFPADVKNKVDESLKTLDVVNKVCKAEFLADVKNKVEEALKTLDVVNKVYTAELATSKGPIRLSFLPAVAPGHVKNFLALAKIGYYNGLTFHRIIKGFMVQGGCPDGTGTGGPGYKIPAEFNGTAHEAGVLSMARTNEPNSAGSQFFICLEKKTHLDGQYTAFGRTADAESLATVKAIGAVAVNSDDRPLEPVILKTVTITEKAK